MRASISKAGWPNGKALDYESRDCRFDPCVGQQDQLLTRGTSPFVLLYFQNSQRRLAASGGVWPDTVIPGQMLGISFSQYNMIGNACAA